MKRVPSINPPSNWDPGPFTSLKYDPQTRWLASSTGDGTFLPLATAENAGLISAENYAGLLVLIESGPGGGPTGVDWDDILSKPSVFPAVAHNHDSTEITDFGMATRATSLSGYSASESRVSLSASDTILGAFAKLGKWVADIAAVAFSGSASDLVVGTLPTGRLPAFGSGDVTFAASGGAGTVAANAIDNTKLADMAGRTLKGRASAGSGDPEDIVVGQDRVVGRLSGGGITDLTGAQITTLLNTFTTSLNGVTPASGGGTVNYLRADGTWADPRLVELNTQAGAYNLLLTDAGKYIRMTSGSAVDLTVPTNASVAFPVGTVIQVRQAGAGQITFVASGGVTINTAETLKLRKTGSTGALIKVATDTWDLTGDLELV
jgi:hypothetical protein